MNRRNFIVGAGSIGAATIGGIAFMGGTAAASIEGREFDNDTIHGTTDDGSLDGVVSRASNIEFGWTGLDSDAEFAAILLSTGNDSESIIDYTTVGDLEGTTGSRSQVGTLDGDITELTDYESSDFEAGADGAQNKSDVTLRLTVVVFYNTDDPVDPSTVEGHISAGDDYLDGLDRLSSNDDYYNYVDADETGTLRVRMNNREKEADVGGKAGGEVKE